MDLRTPLALVLLVPALGLAWLAARSSVVALSRARGRGSLALRFLALAALVLALAEARAVLPRDEKHVVFCVDVSASVDASHRKLALDWVAQAAHAMTDRDRGALVVFGEDAQVERALGPVLDVPHEPASVVKREATDLGRAVRLAMALVPEDVEREIVVLSDGGENAGDALREARVAAASGVRVSTVHVPRASAAGEVLVERVTAPTTVARREPFLVRADLLAQSGGRATVGLERNGKTIRTEEVELGAGRSSFSFPQAVEDSDVALYRVWVQAPGDGNPANNQGAALVRVTGEPRALVVLREKEQARPLVQALERAGLKVDSGGASELPLGSEELARYDLFVTGDVAADRWSPSQLTAVRDYVRDQGGGLLALGGEESFGLGGFYDTPLEEALPVDSDPRHKKVLPALGLVLVIDKSGSMSETTADGSSKIVLAREGAVRTVELLSRHDLVGVIAFDQTPTWVGPLERTTDRGELTRALRQIEPGGGTAIYPALKEAVAALEKTDAKVKHVIVLTDGISDPGPFGELLDHCKDVEITVSTVGVGDNADQKFLEEMARRGGGSFYFTRAASAIPGLFTKDALQASHALLVERTFRPVELRPSEIGLDPGAPPLLGFVLTEPKERAEVLLGSAADQDGPEDGPILARWRFGLGKSAAFTSDLTARWSRLWLDWPGYASLVGRLGRWLGRDPRPEGLTLSLELEGGEGTVTAETDAARPAVLEARISGPPGAAPEGAIALAPVAPGRYRGRFRASRPGTWFAGVAEVAPDGTRQARGTAGAVVSYPREYRDLASNPALLQRIARVGSGRALELDDRAAQVFVHERPPTRAPRPLLPWLALAAAVLLVLEVAVRRFALPPGLGARARSLLAAKPAPAPSNDALIEALLSKKAEVSRADAARASDRVRPQVSPVSPAPPVPPRAPASPPPPSAGPASPGPVSPGPPPVAASPDEDGFTAQLLKAKRRAKEPPPS